MHVGHAREKPHLPICACIIGDLELIKETKQQMEVSAVSGPEKQGIYLPWPNAPINIMPHYPPYRQMVGNIGVLTEGGCPYSRAFDYL